MTKKETSKKLRRRRLPVERFILRTPSVDMVGGARPYIWIGSKEDGALCTLSKPSHLRKWIRALEDMLALAEAKP